MLNDWFEWNGVRCTNYGIHVSEQPPITMPNERATFTSVPGRSGSLTTIEGDTVYDDMTLTATCFIADTSQIADICAWLRGSGTVEFANRDCGYYHGRVTNQITFDKILRGNAYRSFAVNFRCHPFWYIKNVSDIVLTAAGTILNLGTVASDPIITIAGSGDVNLMVGTYSVLLDAMSGSVTIDCDTGYVYDSDNNRMNSIVSLAQDDWPRLVPGNNAINWSGSVTSVTISPRWRYL